MPWIWSDHLATLPNISVSQRLRNDWTQRPVAVWNADVEDLDDLAAALAAEDEEPPSQSGLYATNLAA